MLALIKKNYWWPGISRDVKAFTCACLGHALQTVVFHREDAVRKHITSIEPRASWSVDCAPAISAGEKLAAESA